jgi:hypothetical protein
MGALVVAWLGKNKHTEFSRTSKHAGHREMAMAAYIIGMQKIASLAPPKKELLSRDFLSSSRMTGNSSTVL